MERQGELPGLARGGGKRPARPGRASERGRLRVHDPFELIRWLALSQPDPRKALAELVQNSLDAGARTVAITRFRKQGTACLLVRDDGEGVIPELPRHEALVYLATHVGHSRKRSLTPRERLELMTQGQYGIGLLGFWSLGRTLELRSLMPGQPPLRLVLVRDQPDYTIEPVRLRQPEPERATEALVVGLHREVLPVLSARRIADFLATELRGQLLARDVEVRVVDRLARGTAQKQLLVRPQRFAGQRIEELRRVAVAGYPDLLLDLYLDPAEQSPEPLALYSAGTLVAAGFAELSALDLARAPWIDGRLTGVVDFPALTVAPGSRRGVVVDAAAHALRQTLERVAPRVQHHLDQEEERRAEELDRTLVRDLQRAFAGIYRSLPSYSLLPVAADASRGGECPSAGAAESEAAAPALGVSAAAVPQIEILPAGPLASVELAPATLLLACGESRLVRALPKDQHGRPIDGHCDFLWRLLGVAGEIEPQPPGAAARVRVVAPAMPGSGRLRVVADTGHHHATAEIPVEVVAEREHGGSEGVPEPELIDETGRAWRSRMAGGRWQVNSGHPGFRAVAGSPTLKLRYLALLFAKEVVLHSSNDARLEAPLEQMAEVFGYADRRLARNAGPRKRARRSPVEGQDEQND